MSHPSKKPLLLHAITCLSFRCFFPPSSPLIASKNFSHPELASISHHIPLNCQYPSSRLTHSHHPHTRQEHHPSVPALSKAIPNRKVGLPRPGSKVLDLLSPSDSSLEPLRISIFAARLKKEARHFMVFCYEEFGFWPAMAKAMAITGWIGEDRGRQEELQLCIGMTMTMTPQCRTGR